MKIALLLCSGLVVVGALLVVRHFSEPALPHQVSVGQKTYTLEVADTERKRIKGLGERDSLCDTCAMLFVFEKPALLAFWMKGMRFPLDIVWLLDDQVVHIERNIPADSPRTYRPDTGANRALEFNAGSISTLQVGERVHFDSF